MRNALLSLAFILVTTVVLPVHSQAAAPSTTPTVTVFAMQQPAAPAKDLNLDINVHNGGGGAWYRSPVWIAIGAVAIVVVLLLLVMVARGGGGTTIVRD
jgi:hypothetical protein